MPDKLPALLEEEQLILRAQQGDMDAFGALYENYAPALYRFIYAHVHSRQDAEDLTEEIFLKAWRSLPGYQLQGSPFGAYLFRAARNTLADHYQRLTHEPINGILDDLEFPDWDQAPETIADRQTEILVLQNRLAQLREDYRTVLSLRFIAEMSPEETAGIMGKSVGAIRVLQHRALGALRKLLGVQDGADDGSRD